MTNSPTPTETLEARLHTLAVQVQDGAKELSARAGELYNTASKLKQLTITLATQNPETENQ